MIALLAVIWNRHDYFNYLYFSKYVDWSRTRYKQEQQFAYVIEGRFGVPALVANYIYKYQFGPARLSRMI
jgi:hypothetical protein